MNYKLKGTKKGNAKRIEKLETLTRAVTVVGVVTVTTTMGLAFSKGMINIKKSDEIIQTINSVEDDKYTEEINKMLGLNLDNNYVENVDELCSYMKLIDTYYEGNPIEKYTAKTKLAKDYKKIQDISLELLKNKLANEKKLDARTLRVYMGRDGEYAYNEDGKISLDGENLKFARAIADFQCYSPEAMVDNGESKGFDKYITDLQDLIVGSVKLIDNEKDTGLGSYSTRNVRQ